MITREQYLNALEIIDQYHYQLNLYETNKYNSFNKTEIETWISRLPQRPSNRLCTILLNNRYVYGGKPFKYVEDVNEYDFLRIRNAGKKAWNEFSELISFNYHK